MGGQLDIRGRWEGSYDYDLEKLRPPGGSGVKFDLSVSQNSFERVFGKFKGIVDEVSMGGNRVESRVKGVCQFPAVRFIKDTAMFYVFAKGSRMPFREYLLSLGCEPKHDSLQMPIFYEGNFSDATQASGTWTRKGHRISVPSQDHGGANIIVRFAEATGTWTIRR